MTDERRHGGALEAGVVEWRIVCRAAARRKREGRMTDAREVACYAAAHVMGFVLSALLTTFVLVPMVYTHAAVATNAGGRYLIAFLFSVVVQVVVFFIFIAMRGRRQP
jgi:hypothetical protein